MFMVTTKWIEYKVISAKKQLFQNQSGRNDFSKACQKLTKSLNTSTLESESDNKRIRPRSQKRKPVATSQSSSSNNLDSESSGDNETSHPKISGTVLSKQKIPRITSTETHVKFK
ncbi:hypothetical protein Ocin01_15411 [Orchesella cincta]|uniref:Uncharacterized protein n=1 Tax=Orchesella cincta TaxID=48709 RepID=A0A1D2ME83_ORCCI|nr:hypothetical protein Ocin01_15411 [Orchesella cincta]